MRQGSEVICTRPRHHSQSFWRPCRRAEPFFLRALCENTNAPVTNRGLGLSKLSQSKTNSWVLTGWVRRCWWRRFPAALRTGLCTKPGATSGHVRGSRPQTARCISGQPLRKSHPALSACPSLVPGRTAVRRDVNTLVSEEGKDQEVNTMIYYTALFLNIFFMNENCTTDHGFWKIIYV